MNKKPISRKVGSVCIETHIVDRPNRRPKGNGKPTYKTINRTKRVRGPMTHRPFAEALKGLQLEKGA